MEINDLIFKELIKRGYSLEGNTRVWNIADSKLWYLTPDQAQGYLDFAETDEYKVGIAPKELKLLEKHAAKIVGHIGKSPLNMVDLGCGSGKKASFFIKEFNGSSENVRYCPVDISGHMVEKAIQRVSKTAEVVKLQWNISDFENLENVAPLLRRGNYSRNFFLLLGNTLGNFEIHELLHEIRSSMRDGDYLLIGNGLDNKHVEEDVVEYCRNDNALKRFFAYVPLQLGLKEEEVEYNVRFKNSRMEIYYVVKKDVTVSFQGREIHFYEGDQIVVGFAYHYEKEDFLGYLNMYFGEVNLYEADDGSYALALCRK